VTRWILLRERLGTRSGELGDGMDTGREVIAPKSVRDLVRPQLGLDEDPWELALVQRDLVWKQDRMVGLLDSLLAGYPIGSLLLCRVQQETDARQLGTNQGQERRVAAGTPQLVDGQQRAYALLSLFTERGHGTFYVSLTKEWDRSLQYVEWRPRLADSDADDEPSLESEDPVPADYIDLSKWASVADTVCGTLSDATLNDVLGELAPGYTPPADATARAALLQRLERLCLAWHEQRIPVITATVAGPEDILELFTRVNRGGAQVSGNDLFFAAVKTFWHDPQVDEHSTITAKEALLAVQDASGGFLDTWGALSLLSRLALAGLGESDMVPMRVDRLSQSNKTAVIRALRTISPTVAERIAPFTDALRSHSTLKQALRYVNRYLWEEVFAWVVSSGRSPDSWTYDDVFDVETYLLGASLFSYPQVLGDPYRRDALAVALEAGANHGKFPVARLLAVARNRSESLRRGRSAVLPSTALVDLAKRNGNLVVAAAQGLEIDETDLDWDHILPSDFKERRFRLPRGAGRRFREEAVHFNDPGNFWQIDLSANRILKAASPGEKFTTLETWRDDPRGRIRPSLHSGITSDQLSTFETVGRLLEEGKIEEAAPLFAELIRARNEWLVQQLLARPCNPSIASFAPDVEVSPDAPPRLPEGLSATLGLSEIKAELAEARARLRADHSRAIEDDEVLLGLTHPWAGQAQKLRWVLREVTKRQAKASGAGLGWRIYSIPERQSITRTVPLLPLDSKDHFTLVVTGVASGGSSGPFRIRVLSADSPGLSTIRARLVANGEFDMIDVEGGLELPVPVDADLDWGQMLEAVDVQVRRFREIVEVEALDQAPLDVEPD
jgi:hypothetical protein